MSILFDVLKFHLIFASYCFVMLVYMTYTCKNFIFENCLYCIGIELRDGFFNNYKIRKMDSIWNLIKVSLLPFKNIACVIVVFILTYGRKKKNPLEYISKCLTNTYGPIRQTLILTALIAIVQTKEGKEPTIEELTQYFVETGKLE